MMNDFYNYVPEAAASRTENAPVSNADQEVSVGFPYASGITDEEAEQQLPGYALAFEEYHKRRTNGLPPEEALQDTLQEWRMLWRQGAFVPHRPS